MTVLVTMVWFIGMAIATTAILTITVLSAADILQWQRPRRWGRRASPHSPVPADSSMPLTEQAMTPMGVPSKSTSEDNRGSNAA